MVTYPGGRDHPTTKFLLRAGVLWLDHVLGRWPLSRAARVHLERAHQELEAAWREQPGD